jgi:hypothetical protein
MALDGVDFGMVEEQAIALGPLRMLHPPPGTPDLDFDLPNPLPPLTQSLLC